MNKSRTKQNKPKPKGRKQRVAKLLASRPLSLGPKPKPGKRIKSVTGEVGAERWKVTSRETTFETKLADSRDMRDVQTDLATLATACDQIRDLAEEQAKRLDRIEARLASAESATKNVGADLVAQLGDLERLLSGEGISQALKILCDQQLAAIDQRVAELHALETRVRELVKERKT